MEIKNKKILVLAPHTDDETLGCGGFINKLSFYNNIKVVTFSWCDLPVLKKEFKNACRVLGKNIETDILDFKVRYFDRQKVLDALINYRKVYNPDIILCPNGFDIHQDHHVVYKETIRAFKHKTILGYLLHWNIIGPSDFRLTVDLDSKNIEAKLNAISQYESQINLSREYFVDTSWVKSQEKFEVITWKY